MAILQSIRKRTGLVLVMVGLALLAFLLVDGFSNLNLGMPNKDQYITVNDENISLDEYNLIRNAVEINSQNAGQNKSNNQIDQETYSTVVSNKIIDKILDENHLKSTEGLLKSYMELNGLPTERIELQIANLKRQGLLEMNERSVLEGIYFSTFAKSILTTTAEAELANKMQTAKADVEYAFVSYEEAEKKFKVEVTDKEIESFIKKYEKKFKAQASRELAYVMFEGKASVKDEDAIKKMFSYIQSGGVMTTEKGNKDSVQAFGSVSDYETYVNKFSDQTYKDNYMGYLELKSNSSKFAQAVEQAGVGAMVGPIKDNESYHLAKVLDKKIVDSAQLWVVPLPYPKDSLVLKNERKVLADSLLKKLNNNEINFQQVVQEHYPSMAQGVPNQAMWVNTEAETNGSGLNEALINYAKTASPGYGIIEAEEENGTAFYIIVQTLQKKAGQGFKLAYIKKNLLPSKETTDEYFNKATSFIQEMEGQNLNAFNNAARKKGYSFNKVENVIYGRAMAEFPGEKLNEIQKWAFNKDRAVGDLMKTELPDGGQVVIYLSAIKPKGLASVEDARAQVEPILKQQKIKEKIDEAVGATKDLKAIATKIGGKTGAGQATMQSLVIPDFGPEPIAGAVAFALKENMISKAIQGNNGVIFVKLKKLTPEIKQENIAQFKNNITQRNAQMYNQMGGYRSILLKSADIEDNRAGF